MDYADWKNIRGDWGMRNRWEEEREFQSKVREFPRAIITPDLVEAGPVVAGWVFRYKSGAVFRCAGPVLDAAGVSRLAPPEERATAAVLSAFEL